MTTTYETHRDGYERPERRSAERQVSVLINAGIVHEGRDALCRIRNLSAGGVMIECDLPLAVEDRVELKLRSGRTVEAVVRWTEEGKAGIAFQDADSAALVTERLAASALETSPIGYPLFEREGWAEIVADHKRVRTRIARISPTGISVSSDDRWGAERVFSVSIDGLGDHLTRRADNPADGAEEMSLIFVQPLLYRALNDWLAATPRPNALGPAFPRPEQAGRWA